MSIAAEIPGILDNARRPRLLVNPSFPIGMDEAREDLRRITSDPSPLERPLLVAGGFLDPGGSASYLWWRLRRMIRRDASHPFGIIGVSLWNCLRRDGCRHKLLRAVQRGQRKFTQFADVDVIGCSLGGMAARYAALPREDPSESLQIRQLFTISSPHTGANDADRLPPMHPIQRDLRRGSAFLERINAMSPHYRLHPYVRLRDQEVGVQHAAPRGRVVWWLDTPRWGAAHCGAAMDPRIVADIMRRLRHEKPLTIDPPAPLP